MSTTKAILGIAVIAMIAALGTATDEIRESSAAEAMLATAQQDCDALVAKRCDLAQQAQAAEQDAARLKQAVTDARTAASRAPAEAAAKAAMTWDPVAEGKAFLEPHSEVKQALAAAKIAEMNSRYSALYKFLGLTPAQSEQSEKFLDLTLKRLEQNEDLVAVVCAQGMSVDDPVVDQLELQMRQECEAADPPSG